MKALTIEYLDILKALVFDLQQNSMVALDDDKCSHVCGICGSEFLSTRDKHDIGCPHDDLPKLENKLRAAIDELHEQKEAA